MSCFNYIYVASDKPYTRCNEACSSVCMCVRRLRRRYGTVNLQASSHTYIQHNCMAPSLPHHSPHPNSPPPVTRQLSPGLRTLYEIIPMQTLALWLLRQPSTAQRICATDCVRACVLVVGVHTWDCVCLPCLLIFIFFFLWLSQVQLQQNDDGCSNYLKSYECKDFYIEESTLGYIT